MSGLIVSNGVTVAPHMLPSKSNSAELPAYYDLHVTSFSSDAPILTQLIDDANVLYNGELPRAECDRTSSPVLDSKPSFFEAPPLATLLKKKR